ncbi:MAG: NifU family protein [Alphaproteobacteria bacterium]|nr:NifU family protein [Alphaproteobacteria bacterium]
MGVWTALKAALGLERDPELAPLGPLALTPGAAEALASLPPDRSAHLALLPVRGGWLVQVTDGDFATPHPAFEGLPLVARDEDVHRLHGLQLDHVDGRWRVVARVRLRARETPNPDGRLYVTDRVLCAGRAFFAAGAASPPLVEDLLARADVLSVLVRDHTLTVQRSPGAPWDPLDAAVTAAVRQHVLAAGSPLTPREVGDRDALERAVWEVLEHEVLPGIHRDGGDLELLEVRDGVARVHLTGACVGCPASTLTLQHGIARALLAAFPGEVERVEQV